MHQSQYLDGRYLAHEIFLKSGTEVIVARGTEEDLKKHGTMLLGWETKDVDKMCVIIQHPNWDAVLFSDQEEMIHRYRVIATNSLNPLLPLSHHPPSSQASLILRLDIITGFPLQALLWCYDHLREGLLASPRHLVTLWDIDKCDDERDPLIACWQCGVKNRNVIVLLE